MTLAELAIKIVDINLAIRKICSKGNPGEIQKLQVMKKNKEKTIVEIGMKIQRHQSIDYYMTSMLFKSIINNTEIPAEYKRTVIELSPDTLQLVLSDLDKKTKENLILLNN